MMSFQYFLRPSSRRFGIRYTEAANKLVELHNKECTSQEAKDEIREELDCVLAIQTDESLREET